MKDIRDTFNSNFQAHRGALKKYIHSHVRAADADDVEQETWAAYWFKLQNASQSSPAINSRGWLLGTARRIAANLRNTKRLNMELLTEEAAASLMSSDEEPLTLLVREENNAIITKYASQYGKLRNKLIQNVFIRGMGMYETARKLGLKKRNQAAIVSKWVRKAKRDLARLLSEEKMVT